MITPLQAEDIIQATPLMTGEDTISIQQSLNRVLAEDLIADTDLPPFDRVMMDGIAVNFRAIENGIRSFPIQAMQRAGEVPHILKSEAWCIEIMTGAVCSQGCDTVIPYEHIRMEDGVAHVEIMPQERGKNIHIQGSDKKSGAVLAAKGNRMGPAEIGIAASIGKQHVKVKALPRVLICSTGDELVEIHESPLAHQIRRSNVYALAAALQTLGIAADNIHLPDDENRLREDLRDAIHAYDVILLSGGVSKGKFDLLPVVLSELGITRAIHGIAQRPGKPMWFGRSDECVVFALPGNPVSTLACAARYVLPWFRKQLGQPIDSLWAIVRKELKPHEKMTLFLPVTIESGSHGIMAEELRHQGSGDFSALTGMHGFVEVIPGEANATRYRYFPL